jgi:hypothetical protein
MYKTMHGKRGKSVRWASQKLFKKEVSKSTIWRHLVDRGKMAHRVSRRQRLHPGDAERRLAYANRYLNTPWTYVWFSDWKLFTTEPRANGQNDVVWGERGERFYKEESKWPPRVMVWAAISERGKVPLVFLEGPLDGPMYRQILEDALPFMKQKYNSRHSKDRWWLLQDLDSKATAAATQRWCRDNLPHFIPAEDYPPRSPEFNPIENIWGWMEPRVEAAGLTTQAELRKFLQELWDEVPLSLIRNCIAAVPRRLQAAIKANGGPIEC